MKIGFRIMPAYLRHATIVMPLRGVCHSAFIRLPRLKPQAQAEPNLQFINMIRLNSVNKLRILPRSDGLFLALWHF